MAIACNNYTGISLLPTSYKHLSNILFSRMAPYSNEIIGEYQCGFRRKYLKRSGITIRT